MDESYLYPFLGFEPDPARYEQSNVLPGDSYDVIASLIRMGSSVLEIGCGTGSLLEYLCSHRDCSVIGIEPNKERALLAKAKGLSVIHSYLSPAIDLPAKCFDYIVIADVMEHLEDPSLLLVHSKKFLKSGGSYIISVPNMAHWSVRLKLIKGNLEYSQTGLLDATHLRWFSKVSILRYLGRLHFRINSVHYTTGASLPCYSKIPIFSCLQYKIRLKLLSILVNNCPALFACQNILLAQPVKE